MDEELNNEHFVSDNDSQEYKLFLDKLVRLLEYPEEEYEN